MPPKYTRDDIIDTGEPMMFQIDFIFVENLTWENLTEEDNNFVRLFNQKVICKDLRCELQIPKKYI